jgi:hypothetical protein
LLRVLPDTADDPELLESVLISVRRLGGSEALRKIVDDESLDERVRAKARALLGS